VGEERVGHYRGEAKQRRVFHRADDWHLSHGARFKRTARRRGEQKMMKPAQGYSVALNKETYDLLQEVKTALVDRLGFEPTNGQVVRHLIAVFFNETN